LEPPTLSVLVCVNPIDYEIWSTMQQRVQEIHVNTVTWMNLNYRYRHQGWRD